MRQIIYYEFKKIWGKKANRTALLLGLLLAIACNVLQIQGETLDVGGRELKGVEAVLKQQETESALTDELDEEFLTDFLREYQRQSSHNPNGYDYTLIEPQKDLFALIAKNYVDWNEFFNWETLNRIPTENGIGFYDRRMEKIDTLLNADYSYGNYTEPEKRYWQEKAQAVSTPFSWGSRSTWSIIWNGIGMLIYQLLVVSFCVAPVFAGEYQNRTDALLLSSKYGKSKAVLAKLLVSFSFSTLYILLCGLISIGTGLFLLGTEGYNLPIQLWDTLFPYEWTVISACLVNLGIIILIALLLTAFSLMLSAVSRSPLIVLTADITLFLGTAFLPSSKSSRLWNRILYLFPLHCADLQNVLKSYNDYPFGNLIISYLEMLLPVYLLLTAVCTVCAQAGFKNHQI